MMSQYQRQGQLDVAVQVAMQILRSSNSVRPSSAVVARTAAAVSADANRTAAISLLARSGRLAGLIERAVEQLKKTPRSIGLHQTLADYYQASGQKEKATAELQNVVALRPDDKSRYGFRWRRNSCRTTGPRPPSSTTRCCSRKSRP